MNKPKLSSGKAKKESCNCHCHAEGGCPPDCTPIFSCSHCSVEEVSKESKAKKIEELFKLISANKQGTGYIIRGGSRSFKNKILTIIYE